MGRRSSSGTSRIAWVLLFLSLAAFAGLTFYGMERYKLVEQELMSVRDELGAVKGDVGRAERDKLDLQSKLGRAEVDLKDNRERFSEYAEEADQIKKALAGIVGGDRSDVQIADNRIILHIADSALFKQGTATLSDDGKKALDKIGDLLVEMRERDVLVEGHTSDVPVKDVAKGFETNWELSSARAIAVIRHLHDQVGIKPERLIGSALAEYRPLSRTSPAKNRRIDIVLLPKSLQKIED